MACKLSSLHRKNGDETNWTSKTAISVLADTNLSLAYLKWSLESNGLEYTNGMLSSIFRSSPRIQQAGGSGAKLFNDGIISTIITEYLASTPLKQ